MKVINKKTKELMVNIKPDEAVSEMARSNLPEEWKKKLLRHYSNIYEALERNEKEIRI